MRRTGHQTTSGRGARGQSAGSSGRPRWVGVPLLAAVALGAGGCGAGTPAPQPEMRNIEEPRAVRVIQQALESTGIKAGPGRDEALGSGKPIYVDVTLSGTEFGIAYVAGLESSRLASDLPARGTSDALRVLRIGETMVLLLFEDSYQYDAAETHTATAVAAEAKLRRDVTDFVHRAVKGRGLK